MNKDKLSTILDYVTEPTNIRHGEEYFRELTKFLATELAISCVLIDKFVQTDPDNIETASIYYKGSHLPDLKYELPNTPCSNVIRGELCCYPQDVMILFPEDTVIQVLALNSYIGIPLWSSKGEAIGLMAFMDEKPLADYKILIDILKLVSIKTAFELEKMMFESELKEKNEKLETLNQRLQIALARAEESDNLKTSFLMRITHEIRTPMNNILGFSELLCEPALSSSNLLNYVNIIQNSSAQLMGIIDDLLTIAHIEQKQSHTAANKINLTSILDYVSSIYRVETIRKGLSFNIMKKYDLECPYLWTDKTKLLQILTNLLSNAVKFTAKGEIELIATLSGGILSFVVRDTGIGIEKDKFERIFERFCQADEHIQRTYGGIGLGLSIARANTKLLGGELHMDSEIGIGSTFKVKIPVRQLVLQPTDMASK